MTIGRVSGSMEVLAAAVNPHKEAVELVEQQADEQADDLARDSYATTMKPEDYVYPSENYGDVMKVSAGGSSSSSNNDRHPQ